MQFGMFTPGGFGVPGAYFTPWGFGTPFAGFAPGGFGGYPLVLPPHSGGSFMSVGGMGAGFTLW
jgi:hypothetical protein